MAKVASPRARGLLLVAVLMPLWSSYLVKVYAWRVILQEEGILNWALGPLGIDGPGFGWVAAWLVFSYLWLPYMILPVYAGLERIPNSLIEASADLGARAGRTFRRVIMPIVLPAAVAAKLFLRFMTALTLAFIYVPLLVIALYAFNERRTQAWPLPGLTLKWFEKALNNPGVRDALLTSLKVAAGAMVIALVLGTLASFAVQRYRFFGRETISFLVILPIALPGIVTGMALNATFNTVLDPLGVGLGLFSVIVAHATFCIVVIYNNVIARLRRTSRSIEEASMDLGADTWQTFRYITFPQLRTALLAGGLLAFALSFDEIIVTTFTAGPEKTLPIWILTNLSRPNQLPIVNVVAVIVILLSFIPVYVAQRLTQESGVLRSR